MTRQLATIKRIDNIEPIEGADLIQVATLGGWKVVVKKDEYKIGDLAVYFEIDSWVPTTLAAFLSKDHAPRTYNGVSGERLRTVRLRKQISQGLLLPLRPTCESLDIELTEGTDLTEALNIQKYEQPVDASLAGFVQGVFPSFVPRTDQPRIQNLAKELAEWQAQDLTWTATEKCEGSSFTAYVHNSDFNICSRNYILKEDENNTMWATAFKYNLREKLLALNRNIALQAEIIGPGIQGNIYKLQSFQLEVFDIYDIDAGKYLLPADKDEVINALGMKSVPVLTTSYNLAGKTMSDLLQFAEGKTVVSTVGCEREGVVFNCNELDTSFKVISNKYLIKQQ